MDTLTIGIIILIAVLLNKISSKMGLPALLAFIILGLLFGSEGVAKIKFSNYKIAKDICSVSLIFIMFYGGFGTNWYSAKKVAKEAILLSSVGVIFTALLTGIFTFYVLKWNIYESMLLGAVISSTDAASVFSILRSKKLNLKENSASLLELESGSNDPAAYMLTIIILKLMTTTVSIRGIIYMLFAQVVYAIAVGVIISKIAYYILKRSDFGGVGFEGVFMIAISLLSYAIPEKIGGNGYLSAYLVGIILGNKNFKSKIDLVHFFNGVTGFMQVLIFFLLGLLATPSKLPHNALAAFLVAIFLTFVGRPIVVFSLLYPFKSSFKQKVIVSFAGLRGAASIVFAIVAMVHPGYMKNDIYHVVFFLVLISILFQGSLIPVLAKKIDFIDFKEDVMKTFTDYQDEEKIGFIQLTIKENHPWLRRKIKDVNIPPGVLVVSIVRNDIPLAPNGNTVIEENDILVLSALAVSNEITTNLIKVKADVDEIDKKIEDIHFHDGKLVMLIKRGDNIIIPNGHTKVKEEDILVINNSLGKKI